MRVHRVVCPGSFDPVTNGHLDIIRRAALLHDEVLVVVGANRAKHGMFTVDERVAMLEEVTKDLGNVSVDTFRGLLVEYCRARGVSAIVKGLRAVSDFEYEMEMAQTSRRTRSTRSCGPAWCGRSPPMAATWPLWCRPRWMRNCGPSWARPARADRATRRPRSIRIPAGAG